MRVDRYALLMWNADALDFNPLLIPAPDSSLPVEERKKALRLYLQLFAAMLVHQPGMTGSANQFLK